MHLSREQVTLLLDADQHPISLDVPISSHDERTTLADTVPDRNRPGPDEIALCAVEARELPQAIRIALACLTVQERRALILRFGLDGCQGRTLHEAGRCMGITRERVRQLQTSALEKLRHCQAAPLLASYLSGNRHAHPEHTID